MTDSEKFVHALLSPIAEERKVDWERVIDEPSDDPGELAMRFLWCGARLLSPYVDSDSFPSEDRRTSKRGAKWMRQGATTVGARRAAIFLAQALPTLMADQLSHTASQADEVRAPLFLQDADEQRDFKELIQDHYPLSAPDVDLLKSFRSEFRVLESREIPEGEFPKNGFYMDILDGKEPRKDMVDMQLLMAGNLFRGMSVLTAIEMVIGAERFETLKKDLAYPDSTYYFLTQGPADRDWWNVMADEWRTFAYHARGLTPDAPPLDHPTAQALREEIETRLESLEPAPPQAILDAMSEYAAVPTSNDVDWNVLFDAQMMGYRMREAECDLSDGFNTFDPDWVKDLLRVGETDGDQKMFTVAAVPALDSLPAPFSFTDDVWEEIGDWAAAEAIRHSSGRQKLGMEDGAPTTVPLDGSRRAFELGYMFAVTSRAVDEARSDSIDG